MNMLSDFYVGSKIDSPQIPVCGVKSGFTIELCCIFVKKKSLVKLVLHASRLATLILAGFFSYKFQISLPKQNCKEHVFFQQE